MHPLSSLSFLLASLRLSKCSNATNASAPCAPNELNFLDPMSTRERTPNAVQHRASAPTLCFFATLCARKYISGAAETVRSASMTPVPRSRSSVAIAIVVTRVDVGADARCDVARRPERLWSTRATRDAPRTNEMARRTSVEHVRARYAHTRSAHASAPRHSRGCACGETNRRVDRWIDERRV